MDCVLVVEDMIKHPDRKVVVNLSNGATSQSETSDSIQIAESEIAGRGGVVIRAAGNKGIFKIL
eukprot:Awhi_evm1s9265